MHLMPSLMPIAKPALLAALLLALHQLMASHQIYFAYNGTMLLNQMGLKNVVLVLMVPNDLRHGYDNSPKRMHLVLNNLACDCSLPWQP